MDEILQNIVPDNDVIDVESREVDEEVETVKELETIRIKTVTPFVINSRHKNGSIVATVTYLCLTENDSLLTLNRNFIVSEEDDELLKLLDFHVESMYPNAIICNMLITNHLDSYISEFDFIVDEIEKNEVRLSAINIKSKVNVNLVFNPEVYSSLNFIDNYLFKEDIDNDYDLRLAVAIGSKENESAEFFVVDSIDSIVSMVSTDTEPTSFIDKLKNVFNKEDPSTSIGVVFKATRFISSDKKETVSILTPFDIGVSFSPEKFRGMTVEELQEKYYGDSDQYVATLITDNSRLHGIDKEYMMIRGKSKDGLSKIFLLDSSIKEELKHKIEDY
jgi:hypothetical protein